MSFDRYGRIIGTRLSNYGRYYNDVPSLRVIDETGVGKGGLLSCQVRDGRMKRRRRRSAESLAGLQRIWEDA